MNQRATMPTVPRDLAAILRLGEALRRAGLSQRGADRFVVTACFAWMTGTGLAISPFRLLDGLARALPIAWRENMPARPTVGDVVIFALSYVTGCAQTIYGWPGDQWRMVRGNFSTWRKGLANV